MRLGKLHQRFSEAVLAMSGINSKLAQESDRAVDFQANHASQPCIGLTAEKQQGFGRKYVCNWQIASGKQLLDFGDLVDGFNAH